MAAGAMAHCLHIGLAWTTSRGYTSRVASAPLNAATTTGFVPSLMLITRSSIPSALTSRHRMVGGASRVNCWTGCSLFSTVRMNWPCFEVSLVESVVAFLTDVDVLAA